MPADTRALTRAARARARAKDVNYTTARDDVRAIREVADENGWTWDEAEAWYDGPANQMMCEDCGWTFGMTCPECTGCGCSYGCTGWRHREYTGDDFDEQGRCCTECGANSHYDCSCD